MGREGLIQLILGIYAENSVSEGRINPPGSSEAAHVGPWEASFGVFKGWVIMFQVGRASFSH